MSLIISAAVSLLGMWLGFRTSDTYYQGICHGGAIVGIAWIGVYALSRVSLNGWQLVIGVVGLFLAWQQMNKPAIQLPNLPQSKNRRPLLPWRQNSVGDVESFVEADGVGPGGEEVTCDLPHSLRMRNTGGMGPKGPGSGAGLCVFTSCEHAARYQQERNLFGLQKKMMNEPGGGYPEKVDAMIDKYGKGTDYVQHTGGDEEFLELALKTGRMPGVTYAGRDCRYAGPIAHMVNLVYMDDHAAAILDNNFPERELWMTRKEFLERWRDRGGGWAVVLLASPPPPPPHN